MRLNLGSGPHLIEGFENLDKLYGWEAERGLPYRHDSVEAITISNMLMYLHARNWQAFFADLYRVLEPGGVVRITEGSTADPRSDVYLGHGTWRRDATWQTLTSPELVRAHLELAGFVAHEVSAGDTYFRDTSLLVDLHGPAPKVFYIEGLKPKLTPA